MPANFRKIMAEVPRPLEVAQRDFESDKQARPGRKHLSKNEVARRLEPLMSLIASGHVPVDNEAAQAIQTYVEHQRGAIEKSAHTG